MKVAQRINELLKAKKISKREFAKRLIDLDMRTTKTGETPTESSVYAYLNGNIEIKADMIPFIAEALNVCEQELFTQNTKDTFKILAKIYPGNALYTRYNHIVQLLDYISPKSLETLEKTLLQHKNKTLELDKIIEKI
ncbi:MAG: helix-turn-helix transcriptional regulator [Helicobacter sp.]|nr:helix-turn-helix transcriptional regulator [Helicobacter sp.]